MTHTHKHTHTQTGIGLGMVILTILTSISYNVIMGWAFYYMFASWQKVLPWYSCANGYNTIC
ncbi:hypothetical protein HELRODRAFT_92943 [Helobdella robusta]|uniref:Uncharacterized protein n=1 Tax=Helobdella robusta TaxID=6412 RepID=T1G8P3_HELRO|nr:hypothetical protein HELRODRAFT_92943 [Helobdella robusta]ESO08704.1 hypothetical protein HELRODRAFT_92943 [Helobdella robusta]